MQQGVLNGDGINCLRQFPAARRPWSSARGRWPTSEPRVPEQWRYIPVRRMALFLEQSLYANLGWAVFEPNDTPLWNALTQEVGAFMLGLFRQGAFARDDAEPGVPGAVRQHDDDAGRHQQRHRQHPRRLRPAQTGGIRRDPDRSARRPGAELRRSTDEQQSIFPVNTSRFDPYKALPLPGVFHDSSTTPVAAVSKVPGLKRSSDVIEYKEGGNAVILKGLGRTKYEPITLERGIT